MNPQVEAGLLIRQSKDEVFESHSSPEEILAKLVDELDGELPEEFLDHAIPRDPEDTLVVEGKFETFKYRSWSENAEYRDAEFAQQGFAELPNGTVSVAEFRDLVGTDHRGILSHEFGVCSDCEGDPVTTCSVCTGTAILECTRCDGQGCETCSTCSGTDEIECSDCEGTGQLACDTCEETGEVVSSKSCLNCSGEGVIRARETCSECQGKGKIYVDGSKQSCPRCSTGFFSGTGDVAVENTCPECGGTGSRRRHVTCEECEGQGSIPCGSCSATGCMMCSECDTGTIQCAPCSGSGETACDVCSDGTRTCSTCEGDGETHSVVIGQTKIASDVHRPNINELPYGIDEPAWSSVEPVVHEFERKAGTTVLVEPTEIDLSKLDGDEERYVRVSSRYTSVRTLTYDYDEQNFSVHEMDGDLYYNRHPEPDRPGLFDRVRGWL